jgi:hypothetical protein
VTRLGILWCVAFAALVRQYRQAKSAAKTTFSDVLRGKEALSDADKASLTERLKSAYAKWPLEVVLGLNVNGLAAELSR